jgi:hypothetical protein
MIIEQKQTTCQQQETTKFHSERFVDNTKTLTYNALYDLITGRQNQPHDNFIPVLQEVLTVVFRFGQCTMAIDSFTGNYNNSKAHLDRMTKEGLLSYEYRHRKTVVRLVHRAFYDMHFRKRLREHIPLLNQIKTDDLACPELYMQRGGYHKGNDYASQRLVTDILGELRRGLPSDASKTELFCAHYDSLTQIQRLQCVLSPEDIIELMGFSYSCLAYALRALYFSYGTIRDPRAFVWWKCWSYRNKFGLAIDWSLVAALRDRFRGTPYTEEPKSCFKKSYQERRGALKWETPLRDNNELDSFYANLLQEVTQS